MAAIFWWWGGSALVISGLALLVGFVSTQRVLGLLIDSRGRYSLTHLQVSLWTIVILSLIAGVFFGRWQHNVAHPLAFTIPSVVLGLLGISIGTGVTATAGKIAKNTTRPANVAASAPGSPWKPSLIQIFLLEEGSYADQVVDITKFQNFVFTIVLVLAYIGLAVHTITAAGKASKVTTLPSFSGTFLILLGISYAGYLAGKLPSPKGAPTGLSMATRDVVTRAVSQSPGLRPGRLWRRPGGLLRPLPTANVNVWTTSLDQAPRDGTLIVTGPRPFVLHWTTDNDWHDTTAVPFVGDSYAVALGRADFAGANEVVFKRRYLDDGWESGGNHSVALTA
jgi:hypothetical protein